MIASENNWKVFTRT